MFNRSPLFVLGTLAALSLSGFAQGYETISVVNGGTITGTVKWSGPLPHLASLPINKDPKICDPNSEKTRDLERLVVGPNEGVANTVVYLKDITRGKAMDLPAPRRPSIRSAVATSLTSCWCPPMPNCRCKAQMLSCIRFIWMGRPPTTCTSPSRDR